MLPALFRPGIQARAPLSEIAELDCAGGDAGVHLLRGHHRLAADLETPRVEAHGEQRSAAGEDEAVGRQEARHARAFDEDLAFAGVRAHRFDAGVVVVLGGGRCVTGEEDGAAVGERLRPTVGPFVARAVELGHGLRGAAVLRDPLDPAGRLGHEVDEAVAGPGGAASRQDIERVGEVQRGAAGERHTPDLGADHEAELATVGGEEGAARAFGSRHEARFDLGAVTEQNLRLPGLRRHCDCLVAAVGRDGELGQLLGDQRKARGDRLRHFD